MPPFEPGRQVFKIKIVARTTDLEPIRRSRPTLGRSEHLGGFDLMRPLPMVEKGGVLVVKIGEDPTFNEGQATSVRSGLYAALASREVPRVALDLSGIDFISSTGIALLIGTKRRVDAAQGQLVLFNLHPDIRELFGSMRLTALFEIANGEEEAIALFPSLPAT